jgi:hypothetical protein
LVLLLLLLLLAQALTNKVAAHKLMMRLALKKARAFWIMVIKSFGEAGAYSTARLC